MGKLVVGMFSGWWFQTFLIFTPLWGRFPIWLIFFQMGWNHQPVLHRTTHGYDCSMFFILVRTLAKVQGWFRDNSACSLDILIGLSGEVKGFISSLNRTPVWKTVYRWTLWAQQGPELLFCRLEVVRRNHAIRLHLMVPLLLELREHEIAMELQWLGDELSFRMTWPVQGVFIALRECTQWFVWMFLGSECEARCYNHCKGGYSIRILLCSKISGDQSAKISLIVRHLPFSSIFLIVFNTEGNKNRRRSMWSLGLSGGVECWTGDPGSSKAGGQSYQFRVDEHHTPPTIQSL